MAATDFGVTAPDSSWRGLWYAVGFLAALGLIATAIAGQPLVVGSVALGVGGAAALVGWTRGHWAFFLGWITCTAAASLFTTVACQTR